MPISQVQHAIILAFRLSILVSPGKTIAVSLSYVMADILITLANKRVPKNKIKYSSCNLFYKLAKRYFQPGPVDPV